MALLRGAAAAQLLQGLSIRCRWALPLAALLLAACTGTGHAPVRYGSPTPTVSAAVPLLQPLGRFSSPVWAGAAPGDPSHLYLAERTGRVLLLDRLGNVLRVVLDLRPQLRTGNEQGLLDIAFDPAFSSNHRLYAYFCDKDGDNRLQVFTVWNGVAIVPHDLLDITWPYPNHNGGQLLFDRSGMLLLGTGDGGSAGDPDNQAQDRASLLGKILRIDPRTGAGAKGNPYPLQPKVWAVGLRDPWRFSFDANGDLYLGDVGQSREEELDVVPPAHQAAANYGWSVYEGDLVFKPNGVLSGGEQIEPALTYRHSDGGCSITGGEVYHGRAIPSLRGNYVFGDYCTGQLWAVSRTRVGVTPTRDLGPHVDGLQAFGHDADGELLVMSAEQLFRLVA